MITSSYEYSFLGVIKWIKAQGYRALCRGDKTMTLKAAEIKEHIKRADIDTIRFAMMECMTTGDFIKYRSLRESEKDQLTITYHLYMEYNAPKDISEVNTENSSTEE